MAPPDLYLRFLVALAIGLGVGIERGWKLRAEPPGAREAGIRTFAILSLTGFAASLARQPMGDAFVAILALGVICFLAIGYWSDVRGERGDRGLTTEAAALLTFILGALAGAGDLLAAGVSAVVLVALLDQKDSLHGFLARIERFELTAALKLLLVSVVLLPVLPDKGFGPGEVLNPYELWWAVVVIGTLGFAGHAAMRIAGPERGALFMGLVGGMVSSTGVTVSAARSARLLPASALPLAGAVAIAQAVMFVRTGLLVMVLNATLIGLLWLPLLLGALAAVAGALFVSRLASTSPVSVPVEPASPDMLQPAAQFIAIVAVVLVIAHYAQAWAGDAGIALSGLLSGAVDVDAATVSASRMASTTLHAASTQAATFAIIGAIVSNSIVKSLVAGFAGTRVLAVHVSAVLAGSVLAALAGLVVSLSLLPLPAYP
jgi:uncharacterized membrane protein (DUF4010 family)